MLQQTHSRALAGSTRSCRAFTSSRVPRTSLQVTNALTRQKKEDIVQQLKENLDNSIIVFGLRHNGLNVETVQKLRRAVPEQSKIVVAKNNLMKVAVQDTEWTTIAEKGCTGDNAWIFVNEECIGDTIKAYFKFEEELFDAAKKSAPKNTEVVKPTDLSCIVMDGKYLSAAELKKCEALPTKKQLLATVARLIKEPARRLATGVKMVPTKLAIGIKKVSELDEDKSKTCAEVAQPKTA